MPGKQSEEGPVEAGASEDSEEEGLGGLTLEELQQGQEAARVLEDMMALSAQTLVRAEVDELYEEVRPLGQGRYGRVLLVTHRQKGTPLALKQLPKPRTSLRGFLYEFCVGLSLGVHSAIVTAYGIGIESAQSYSFLTEPVLHGDLMAFIQPKVEGDPFYEDFLIWQASGQPQDRPQPWFGLAPAADALLWGLLDPHPRRRSAVSSIREHLGRPWRQREGEAEEVGGVEEEAGQ
ncbi:hypothetical protein EGM_10145 [Macaca fascicularis]|uniref:Protein kinase domain-containing protein n=1 Tax=Macaca fascicularis TaxID=9541 RepID=G7PYZ5_MACFA|nr:hypothetical protein EGM_10145 [Macaca fascicularis]